MKTLRTWPRLPIIALVAALLAGVSAAMFVSYRRSASPVAPNAVDVKAEDQTGVNKGSPEAANTDGSETSASSPVSATGQPLTTKSDQQTGKRSRAQRQGRTHPKDRNANGSRVEFKGPPVRKP